eukprot:2118812-Amphidinium_carterae.1
MLQPVNALLRTCVGRHTIRRTVGVLMGLLTGLQRSVSGAKSLHTKRTLSNYPPNGPSLEILELQPCLGHPANN